MLLTTRSGRYVIADVSDPSFYPGKRLPGEYQDKDFEGPWFFWPPDWLSEDFGGIVTAWLRGYPMVYSIGFPTAEDALAAAEKWEAEEPERLARQASMEASMESGVYTLKLG